MTRQSLLAILFTLALVVSGCGVNGARGDWWVPQPKSERHTLELDCSKDGIVRECLPIVWDKT